MARRKARVDYVDQTGDVTHGMTGTWDFIYGTSTVIDVDRNLGDKVILPDGREFAYAKSSGVCASGFGCDFTQTGFQSYSTPSVAAAVGDTKVIVTAGMHDAIVKDELAGGYFVSWPAALKDQFRGIIGNDAADANAVFTIYLDGPLTYALVAATTGLEVYENPYAAVSSASANASLAKAGVAATYISAANIYFWVQTKGMAWVAPQSDVTGRQVGFYWRHDGSAQGTDTALGATVAANNSSQYAGHRVLGSYAGNGPLSYLNG